MKAVFPGSFDPLTNGHLEIIKRASKIFPEVIVLIAKNSSKNYWFTNEEKKLILEKSVSGIKNVKIEICNGLIVNYLKKLSKFIVVRSLRDTQDFIYELSQFNMNTTLFNKFESVYFISKSKNSAISSSTIKEVFLNKGDISKLVPKIVLKILKSKKGNK